MTLLFMVASQHLAKCACFLLGIKTTSVSVITNEKNSVDFTIFAYVKFAMCLLIWCTQISRQFMKQNLFREIKH